MIRISAMPSKPTDSELEILQVLWAKGQASVREVFEVINELRSKEVKYTTILKLMQLMTEKDLVKRDTSQRTHIYTANVEEQATQGHLLQRFIQQTFRGSTSNLVMQALGNHDASQAELEEIKALIEKIEQAKEE
ncbi:MAG: BlaI/MecI/CopY family transcriptional regulator [Bacteroidota bacterium]